jgi:DNA polymerase-1
MRIKSNLAPRGSQTTSVRGHVAIDYLVAGPGSTNRVHRPDSRLVGMELAAGAAPRRVITRDIPAVLKSLAGRPRLYPDALAARAVEGQHGLPLAEVFDDLRIMGSLLEVPPPLGRQQLAAMLLDNSVDSVERTCSADRRRPDDPNRAGAGNAETYLSIYRQGRLRERIRRAGLEAAYRLELDVVDPTIAMVNSGMGVDRARLEETLSGYRRHIQSYRRQIESAVGRPFNAAAAAQVTNLLYEELRLPIIKETRNGNPAQDLETLRRLARFDESGVVPLIIEYQKIAALESFAAKLLASIDPTTGRVHAELDAQGTATGRYTCREPHLQALPAALLEVFIAPRGFQLLEADFSQIELRVLASCSQDPKLLAAYRDPRREVDLHRRTAAAVLRRREHEVTEAQRNRIGKQVNFAVIYGQTEYGLAEALDIPLERAGELMCRFFAEFPGVRRWIDAAEEMAENEGAVRSLFGRRRTLADVDSWDSGERSRALRQAVNHVVQGTAADILKLSLARLHAALPRDCKPLMTVHDSLLVEAPNEQVKSVTQLLREVMEVPPPDFGLPLRVKVTRGKSWAECKGVSQLATSCD